MQFIIYKSDYSAEETIKILAMLRLAQSTIKVSTVALCGLRRCHTIEDIF